jgi:transposase
MLNSFYAGLDLHGNNLLAAVIDQNGKRLAHRKLPCDLRQTVEFLAPFKKRLRSAAVESTFNWYWLVDGLRAAGFPVVLANPAAIVQYEGLKHADDKSDAFFLAEMQRLKILPTGYIYDPKLRPVRDLLRRRMGLVRHRTALLLSFKSLHARTTGQPLALSQLKAMDSAQAQALYEHPANQVMAGLYQKHLAALSESISLIEKEVLGSARKLPCYGRLKTLPGVGMILGLTITMEVGEISRFRTPGDFASYARTVDAQASSNGRKKGDQNQKCGNKYLGWAFVEAANFAKRYDENCRRWFDRKAAKTSTILATKALACKLAKAAWHVMSAPGDYDAQRMFPGLAGAPQDLGRAVVSQRKGLAKNPQT